MIYEYFRATGAYEAGQGLSTPFSISLQSDDVQDFDVRWDHALLPVSEMPSDIIQEGLYKSKLEKLCSTSTVMALYDPETARNYGQPNYSRLKTSVKLHTDQMMRTRNFRVWNEVVGRGAATKNQKRKPALRGKWESFFSVKAHGQCSKGDSCCFSHHRLVQGYLYGGQRRKGRSSS